MPKTLIKVDLNKTPEEQGDVLHNRWHPDIPMVAMVKPGDEFRVECIDWTGGQINNDNSANDIRDVDLTKVHYLSGPIGVEGAEPGDLLVVDILDIGTLAGSEWGFTGLFAKENGGGFLTEHYPDARKACWDFHGIYTTSRHIPGCGIRRHHASGTDRLSAIQGVAGYLEQARGGTDRHRSGSCAALGRATLCGHRADGSIDRRGGEDRGAEGARTVPPREHGGNCDIKNLTRGSKVYFPVYVKNAGLSMGDIHFSQGDGEISFCGAIEMAGWIDIHVEMIKGGMSKYGVVNPIFQPSPDGAALYQPSYFRRHIGR